LKRHSRKKLDSAKLLNHHHAAARKSSKSFQRRAVDFVQKPYREQQLLDAINEALQRDAQQRRAPLPADAAAAPGVALALLSAREREVMQLALQGLPSKLIAKQLSLSHRTVEHHRSRLLEKLGVASMAELMRLNYQQALDGSAAPPR
jgi:two-component system response regulator DctR